ncbi:MAG: mannosyltransferase family protein [Kineosporiaceae bacterium]
MAALWIAGQSAWLVGDNTTLPPYLDRWYRWDARVFELIAQYGYSGPPDAPGRYEAFFPGMPLALKLVHLLVRDWTVAGLLISFVAGAVAVVALVRLAALDFGADVGRRAALALCVSPLTGFLASGYSEALFMAFAFTAWLNARRGRWLWAGTLAAGASATRITGLFLAAALVVEFATAWLRGRRADADPSGPRAVQALWLCLPLLPIAAFFAFLHHRSGRWDYYFEVQRLGWGRSYVGFGNTLRLVWEAAVTPGDHLGWAFGYRMEMAAMGIGVVLTAALLVRRRWAEATFVALPVLSLAPMASYSSAARTSLTWWPLWIALALLAGRGRTGVWLGRLYLALSVPTAVLVLAAFTLWHWAG